ncbi:unnamed protein product [Urochloa humidicola]
MPAAGAMTEEPLNADVALEIVARTSDAATVVRCAAVSKPLRRRILDPGFHPRLLEQLRAAAGAGGFVPSLLIEASYWEREVVEGTLVDTTTPSSSCHPAAAAASMSSIPVSCGRSSPCPPAAGSSSSAGTTARPGIDLCVYNTVTGHMASLPTMDDVHVDLNREGKKELYPPALLSVDGADRSFEVLVLYRSMDTYQVKSTTHSHSTISSEEENGSRWSAATEILWPPALRFRTSLTWTTTSPAVIGRTVHWLCVRQEHDLTILALDAEAVAQATATVIELPQELLTSMADRPNNNVRPHMQANNLILSATAEGKRLSLVVAEKFVISVWTLLPNEGSTNRWNREVVIRRREIDRKLTAGLGAYQPIRFDVFGEKSGTVLFWMKMVGLVQLNLGTKKAQVIYIRSDLNTDWGQAFVHEIDLVPLLQSMKPF